MNTVFVLVDGQVVPLKDAFKTSREQRRIEALGESGGELGEIDDEIPCCMLGESQDISTEENDWNRHFFSPDSFVFQIKGIKITAIHLHCFVMLIAIVSLISSLGGNFVDDDLVNAPFLELTYESDIIGLRVAALACSFPLLWDLMVDIYNVNYRGSDPAANADREEYRRAKLVCIKESWIRCGFIMALALPSAILLWSDSSRLLSGRAVLPFLTQFVRIIVIFCMSNGYTSELYDLTRRQRFGTLLISISFVIGILLVFYGRIMKSRSLSPYPAIIGLALAGISTTLFVGRVTYRAGRLFVKEMMSIQSTIQMEEYVFMCYTLGACFLCVTVFCSFFGHNGTMQYDKLSLSGLLTYHILFPLGVLTSVIVSGRTIRNWSLEVRYEIIANRLSKLESVIDAELIDRSSVKDQDRLEGQEGEKTTK